MKRIYEEANLSWDLDTCILHTITDQDVDNLINYLKLLW